MAITPRPARPTVDSGSDLVDDQGPIPTFPPRQLDDRGRLVPIPEHERRARTRAASRALAALDALPRVRTSVARAVVVPTTRITATHET